MLLIERDKQLTCLGDAFRACADGRGQVTLVSGPVGSGKTALLLAFGRQAVRDGAKVIGAGGSRAERTFPFGMIGQLIHDAGLAPNSDAYAAMLQARCALAGSMGDPGSDGSVNAQVDLPYLQTISAAFATLATEQPLVIAVDDLHYADHPSLHCLLFLIRRLRSTRIMVVLSESSRPQPTHLLFRTDILSQPHASRVSLAPLSRRGVNQLIEASLAQPAAPELATACFDMSAGNPMLTRALIDDHVRGARESDAEATAELSIDDAFEQAVLSFLYRHDPCVLAVAQAVAVLDEAGSPQLLARMVDIGPETAAGILRALEGSGLLAAGRFRHPRARRALLNHLPADERRALHRKAAELLHENGAAPSSVADHLVEAAYDDAAWVVPVLRDAARHALADNRPERASAPLRLALRAARDNRQRVAARTALIGAEWQLNPLMVTRHLGDLLSEVRADPAHARDALAALPYLLWHGRVDESVELLTAAADAAGPTHVALATELHSARQLFAATFPAWAAAVSSPSPDLAQQSAGLRSRPPNRGVTTDGGTCADQSAIGAHLQPTMLLTAALGNGSRADAIGAADHVLQRCSSQKTTPEPVAAALLALIYADRPDRCLVWCESLALARPTLSLPPAWQAVFKAIQAESALRLGNLSLAEQAAIEALAIMPPVAWGIAIGGVLATLISATTEMGALDRAREYLATPVPQALFGTPLGLHYLRARGRYYRATGRLQAALTDFRSCGELMSTWRLDLPAIVAWRLESARTYLALGRSDHAAELAREQLRQLGPLDGRTRGATMRTIAATYAPEQRTAALDDAVDMLHGTGDRLELAHALADLGRAWQALGQSGRARLLIRRAHHISVECGAEPLSHSLSHDDPNAGLIVETPKPGGEATLELLSDAERRVAALAVQGYTNREISSRLYVTVSTVEQHLTRVYRKMNVKRRADLPVGLAPLATVQSDASVRAS